MHYRLVVNSEDRFSGSVANFEHKVNAYPLTEFAGKHVHYALEWITNIKASDTDPAYGATNTSPLAIALSCPSIIQGNTRETWKGSFSSIVSILPGYMQSGLYGFQADSQYINRGQLACVAGDDLNTKGLLRFQIIRFPSESESTVGVWEPTHMDDFSFSLVFWTVGVPKSPTFDHFHLYLSSADRISGTKGDAVIPVDFSVFSMHEGTWNVGVSFNTPILSDAMTDALLLECSTLSQQQYSNKNILGYLPAGQHQGETQIFGRRLSVKQGLHADSLGCYVSTPIDHVGTIDLRILDADFNAATIDTDYVVCLTFYRVE